MSAVPQLPLALRYPQDQRLESFIGAPDGALAQLRAIAVGASQDWVYLEGAAGTGKTHQALATCSSAEQAGRLPTYVPVPAVAGRLQAVLEGLEHRDLVALDGLDAIAGSRDDEVALFDFHNRARAAGATVLYTAQHAPAELGLRLPDLQSRLGQCVRVVLQPLDEEGRAAVLRERAQRRGLAIDEPAVEWLLSHTGRELGGLITLLDWLDRESLAAKRRITVPFLRQVLEDGRPRY
ncbi:DnaA regulatory inactivator Hda [Stenotrophomonas sp. C3(2023)]|uniref:DnaA regulatory inactivator Hda n=1 Tax=Stenotrophomonas sp. C3(2023) TaxID=3080277 RepID=UPI00293C48B8|nr:DnaA regulatory inactivator Hda [Stenotrophomonas sp. C3(2023)]MDV3467883.1 DnaA regulatory inactivator Hda [Stenotrophomonas sp. C3(2023)]